MKEILPDFDFCVVDLETTGLSPQQGASIIEIGAVLIENARINQTFHRMADPGHSIPENITNLTGITDEDVKGADSPPEVIERFQSFRADSFLVAHNASFDLGFLKYYAPTSLNESHVDTVQMARRLFNFESNALTNLIEEFDLERSDAHRALDDALATAELFLIMAQEITEPGDYLRCNLPSAIREKSPFDLDTELTESKIITDKNEAKEFVHDLLVRSDTRVGLNKWSKILTGSRGKNIKKYRDHEGYGRFSDWTQKKVKSLLNDMLEKNKLRKHGDHYPVLEPVISSGESSDPLTSSKTNNRF